MINKVNKKISFLSHFLKLSRTSCFKMPYPYSKKFTKFTTLIYCTYQNLLNCIYHIKKLATR